MGQGKFAAAAPLVVGLALAMLALWATSPVVQPLPGRDSSVYLSVGRDMLEGARLYTEVWDHKGPLVHHLNALGWAVGGGVWGVWGVRAFLLTLVVLLAWAVLRAVFSPLAATAGMVMALAPLPLLLEGGNMVEEYGLVGSWAALALVVLAGRTGNIAAPGVAAAGLLVGANFLLRPNLVASPGVATGWLILKSPRPMPMVLPAALGALALILGVGALLAAQGSLPAAVAAVWSYNLVYAQLREPFHLWPWVRFAVEGCPLLAWAALAWCALLLRRCRPVWGGGGAVSPLLGAAMVAFPLELLAVSLSGRPYLHYLVSPLPAAAVLVAAAGEFLLRGCKGGRVLAVVVALGGTLAAASMLRAPLGQLARAMVSGRLVAEGITQRVGELQELGVRRGPLWVWGAESSVYLLSGRSSPVPFGYVYPLLTPWPGRTEAVAVVQQRLCRHAPEILDASGGNPVVPPVQWRARQAWRSPLPGYQLSQEVEELLRFVEDHWQPGATLPATGWRVWWPPPAAVLRDVPLCRESVVLAASP